MVSLALAACGSDDTNPSNVEPDAVDDVAEDVGEDDVVDDDATPGGGDDTGDFTNNVDTNDDSDAEPTLVRIVAPVATDEVAGTILVRAEAVGMDERVVDNVSYLINGEYAHSDVKLPTEFWIDTRQHPRGNLTITADAQDGFERDDHEVTVFSNNPEITFVEVTASSAAVQNGDVVSLIVELEGPPELEISANFSALDSEWMPGDELYYALGGGRWAVTHVIDSDNTRRDGTYQVPITIAVEAANWEVSFEQMFVVLRNGPETPLRLTDGIYVDEKLPVPDADWDAPAPTISSDSNFIVTGGSAPLLAELNVYDTPSAIVGLIVGIEGHVGYYQIPVDDVSETLQDIQILLRSFAPYETPPGVLPIRVAARDERGRVSPYGSKVFTVKAVGSGDIQISVSWDTDADVDLHVIDPQGCETNFTNKTGCASGAELDLDSNIGCPANGVKNENIFWPEGQSPAGTYTVLVNYYNGCNASVGPSYVVTTQVCGETQIYEGSFNANADTLSASGATFVTEFDSTCQNTIKGRARYQDRTFDETGFGALSWRPVRNAVVEIRQLDGVVVGNGTTDRNGDYNIRFGNTTSPGLVVAVKAKTDETLGLREIEILDHPKFKKLYEVTSPPIIFEPGQEVFEQDMNITVDLNAGAFNIFDVIQRGYDLIRLKTGRTLGDLTAFWKTGSDTTDTFYCSQFLYDEGECTDLTTVSIQGKDTDRDEYDDMVILKEFFRFAIDTAARDDHPGGITDGTRDDPRRAWTEGVSTFFANDVLATPHYVNSRPFGIYLVDETEVAASPYAFNVGTEGNHSRYLVTALLWDLADSAIGETVDQVDALADGIYDVVFNYLPSTDYVDRGAEGVDIVDFLDGWFCRGWASRVAIEALIAQRGMAYDFEGPTECSQ